VAPPENDEETMIELSGLQLFGIIAGSAIIGAFIGCVATVAFICGRALMEVFDDKED
jgi:type III secretory pathway component EscT